jgi:peroxiredoxin Q/BCP
VEGEGFRDEFKKFKKNNYTIIGMSADKPTIQKKFAEKREFQYQLLCDEEKNVLKAYHAWGKKKLYGREYDGIKRISYLIDEEGMIIKAYEKVKTKTHAQDILKDIGDPD